MQRLFSTFPNGQPGDGLLLLRLVAGVSLMFNGYGWFTTGATWVTIALACGAILVGALLFIGLMTPLAAVAAALGALLIEPCSLHVLSISAAIVLLGPGAYAVDARMFGRREIVVTNTGRDASSVC
jgi:hypothetical protein